MAGRPQTCGTGRGVLTCARPTPYITAPSCQGTNSFCP